MATLSGKGPGTFDVCVNPEMKGMAGAEEGAQKEGDMACVIMLNSDT